MITIYWPQLFHFYQPPTQLPSVLEKICEESYRPLLEVFRQHPSARATVNINEVLTEMLRDHGYSDIIQGLKELADRGQIEFTGSGKYHPILPLVPPEEARRQIELNHKTNAFFLGDAFKAVGFFPPRDGLLPGYFAVSAGDGAPLDNLEWSRLSYQLACGQCLAGRP